MYSSKPESGADVTRPSRWTMQQSTARLYQQIFEDTTKHSLKPVVKGAERVTGEVESVIELHHSKKGFRFVLQINHKVFLLVLLIALVAVSSPILIQLFMTLTKH